MENYEKQSVYLKVEVDNFKHLDWCANDQTIGQIQGKEYTR